MRELRAHLKVFDDTQLCRDHALKIPGSFFAAEAAKQAKQKFNENLDEHTVVQIDGDVFPSVCFWQAMQKNFLPEPAKSSWKRS
ncbi:hypothetical protein [Leisingera caerulea]|uniref:hypothetical protein n=1 Tax=Leisingera caerulea TaxID=506591 RepID=UPI0012B53041|nr:hypothetical protein [Leisingera caerulea]